MSVATPQQGLVRFEGRAMASPLRLTMAGRDPDAAERAWALVQAEFYACESDLSRFQASSGLTVANLRAGDGGWYDAPRRLVQMAVLTRRAHRISGGAFDPRVIQELEELGEDGGTRLGYASGREADGWLEADPRGGRLRLATPIDSGGIGKGFALRRSRAALLRRGLPGHGGLLEAGGDIVAWGEPTGGAAWRIGMEEPGGSPIPVAVIEVTDGAVATSSVRLRRWIGPDGTEVHHLIDPRTRRPAMTGLQSVTVATADPVWAEVWSKTLFIAGADAIAGESEGRGLAAWWVTDDGQLWMNERAAGMTIWTR